MPQVPASWCAKFMDLVSTLENNPTLHSQFHICFHPLTVEPLVFYLFRLHAVDLTSRGKLCPMNLVGTADLRIT